MPFHKTTFCRFVEDSLERINKKMERVINLIDEKSLELKSLMPIKQGFQKALDKKFRLEFNYNSNHIEGNTLTYTETALLLIKEEAKGNHTMQEFEEMRAHDVAFTLIKQWATDKERSITETDIKELNKIILVKPFWKDAITSDGQKTRRLIKVGDYKEFPNSVQLNSGEIFEYATVTDTPILMGELIDWYKKEEEKKELTPFALAALLHYKFVRIHPFDDGNGRISRLLMNYVLLKNDLPPVVIKSSDKRNYLSALNSADVGDLNAFIKYIAEQLIWSLDLSIKAAKGESIEETDDLDKEIAVWKKQATVGTVDTLHRSDELVYDLYFKGGIKEMFEEFIEKHKPFNEMFTRVLINTFRHADQVPGLDWLTGTIEKIGLKSKANIIKEGEVPEEAIPKDTFKSILVEIRFEEYKYNEKNPFFIASWLRFDFLPYTYTVKCNGIDISEKKYTEYLTIEERKKLINDCVKNIFEEIKRNSSK